MKRKKWKIIGAGSAWHRTPTHITAVSIDQCSVHSILSACRFLHYHFYYRVFTFGLFCFVKMKTKRRHRHSVQAFNISIVHRKRMERRECTTIGNNFQNNRYLCIHFGGLEWKLWFSTITLNDCLPSFRLHTIFSNNAFQQNLFSAHSESKANDVFVVRSWSWNGRASWTRMIENDWMSRDVYWNQFDNRSLKRIKLIMIIHQNGAWHRARVVFSSIFFASDIFMTFHRRSSLAYAPSKLWMLSDDFCFGSTCVRWYAVWPMGLYIHWGRNVLIEFSL